MPSMQVSDANMEANTRESEQVLAKNQGWTRKLIFVDYMPHASSLNGVYTACASAAGLLC